MTKFRAVLGALVAASALSAGVQAQDFPTKPVTMILPFAAGGGTDITSRVLAGPMSEALVEGVRQSVILFRTLHA